MADITYCTFKEFGDGAFCIQDYRGIAGDKQAEGKMLGLILYPNDTITTVNSFIRLATELKPEIVMVEFHYLLEDYSTEAHNLEVFTKEQLSLFEDDCDYFNMDSYEERVALGKFTARQIDDYFIKIGKLRAKGEPI